MNTNMNLTKWIFIEGTITEADRKAGELVLIPTLTLEYLNYKEEGIDWTLRFSWLLAHLEITFNWKGV
tara:strand:- start:568 stop:771 length:204 start_codon:yes stop_codon:yes gene_type:complete